MLSKNTKIIVVAAVLIILFPLGYSVVCSVFSQDTQGAQPFLEKPDAQYKNCVRETDYMRFYHMDLLKEIRDEAVRQQGRGDLKLSDCRKCHTNREQFCDKCHKVANLYLDCFGCHYYPETATEITTMKAGE